MGVRVSANCYVTVSLVMSEVKTVEVLFLKLPLRNTSLRGRFVGYFDNVRISLWVEFSYT